MVVVPRTWYGVPIQSEVRYSVLSSTPSLFSRRSAAKLVGLISFSRHLGPLARHHICQLQSILGFERNGFHLPIPLCTVGIVRSFLDSRSKSSVFRSDDDSERATATCSRASMKLWLLMFALSHKRTSGRVRIMSAILPRADMCACAKSRLVTLAQYHPRERPPPPDLPPRLSFTVPLIP